MQIASMVTEEGGDARRINLCQRCCNATIVQQGKQPLTSMLWKVFGSEHFSARTLGVCRSQILADAAQVERVGGAEDKSGIGAVGT